MARKDDRYDEFLKLLRRFDHAMLVTLRDGEMRSRPMAVAEATASGHLWFMSNAESAKQEEIGEHPDVNVSMQEGRTFLSISGGARVVRDSHKAEELWRESQRMWFPDGPTDPNLVLIEIVPHYAEYWDGSGTKGLRYLFEQAGSLVGRGQPGDDASIHAKVGFDH